MRSINEWFDDVQTLLREMTGDELFDSPDLDWVGDMFDHGLSPEAAVKILMKEKHEKA